MYRALCALGLALLGGLSCGPPPSRTASASQRASFVTTERTSRGGRLITVAADGARLKGLTTPDRKLTVDQHPFYSPDGKWLVFSSNRERNHPAESSLWAIPAEGGSLTRLTRGEHNERDPRFSPDGRTLYFSSDRHGSYDLFKAPLAIRGRRISLGQVLRLTTAAGQELSPSVSPDGRSLVYMAIDAAGVSALFKRSTSPGDEPIPLTPGPSDMTPAWGPKGNIVFSSVAEGRNDADLFIMTSEGSERRVLIDEPLGDETGARFSRDGRYVFATSVFRAAKDARALLGSVVFVDLWEKKKSLRALHDPGAVESRIGVAVAPIIQDATRLHGNPVYATALRRVFLQERVRDEERAGQAPTER